MPPEFRASCALEVSEVFHGDGVYAGADEPYLYADYIVREQTGLELPK